MVDAQPTGDASNNDQTKSLIKGMRELGFKNIVTDMQSKKKTWADINVPEQLLNRLNDLAMDKPSIIQAFSIPKILEEPPVNYLFQAINGSGKTLAFGIPAIMKSDPKI